MKFLVQGYSTYKGQVKALLCNFVVLESNLSLSQFLLLLSALTVVYPGKILLHNRPLSLQQNGFNPRQVILVAVWPDPGILGTDLPFAALL